MTTDLILAVAHHLLAFGLAAILAAEIAMVRPGMTAANVKRLGLVDAHYGVLAGLLVLIGVLRVAYGIKGPEAYLPNPFFWAKMAAFGLVALLSLPPTIAIFRWRAKVRLEPAFCPYQDEVERMRAWLKAEAVVFLLIPIFAALMARGYGLPR